MKPVEEGGRIFERGGKNTNTQRNEAEGKTMKNCSKDKRAMKKSDQWEE